MGFHLASLAPPKMHVWVHPQLLNPTGKLIQGTSIIQEVTLNKHHDLKIYKSMKYSEEEAVLRAAGPLQPQRSLPNLQVLCTPPAPRRGFCQRAAQMPDPHHEQQRKML